MGQRVMPFAAMVHSLLAGGEAEASSWGARNNAVAIFYGVRGYNIEDEQLHARRRPLGLPAGPHPRLSGPLRQRRPG